MKWREIWQTVRPLLWEGVKWYAPQIRIPANLIEYAGKYLSRSGKVSKKIKKRIYQLDDMIEKMETTLENARKERENMILDQADLYEFMDQVKQHVNKKRAR
jgi:hypothetical protein